MNKTISLKDFTNEVLKRGFSFKLEECHDLNKDLEINSIYDIDIERNNSKSEIDLKIGFSCEIIDNQIIGGPSVSTRCEDNSELIELFYDVDYIFIMNMIYSFIDNIELPE